MKTTEIRKRPPAQVPNRMIIGGIDYLDLTRLMQRTETNGQDWVKTCEELGDYDFALAIGELQKGHRLTARYFFLAAQSLYRLGQYGLHEATEEKLHLNSRLCDAFARAAALFDPPLEEVNIPYKGYNMHGWLYLPNNAPEPCPVVLLIPGATGFKEEQHPLAWEIVQRGMACLSIDGPGQGITRYVNGGTLEIEIEKAHKVMIDHLEKDGRFGKIGIVGVSTGGYYVSRTAAVDHRLVACVALGGSYYPKEIVDVRPPYLHHFAVLFGTDEKTMQTELFPKMNLEGLAEKIECPLLIIHGEADPIFSVKGVQRIYDEARSADKTIKVYPNAWHCAPEYGSEVSRLIADWSADHLKK